ncbi:MAG: molybdopterin-dependent oxidoreductase [Verrucomicrobiaceae bacterium]|nr:molybdopterin-dependent oxidoreductase [Verrucomicrobiaceae bacterium]
MSNPLSDMEHPDVIFAIGTNMTECHPVAATRLKKAIARGAKMIVADPRRTRLAKIADLHLPLRVGSDVALLLAMANVIARENLIARDFINARTAGSDAFLEHIKEFTPAWASPICEVDAELIEQAARWYGEGNPSAIFYTLGITEHISGVDNVQSLCNLALMTGNLGNMGGGINPMRGQNNIQGAGDCGAVPGNFPGFQPCADPEKAKKFSKAYGTEIDAENGITKVTALNNAGKDGAEGIHAMLIDGENTVVTDPDKNHCEQSLKNLEHLVVIDIFMTETAQLANIVLPATAFAETDGVQTNTERRVQRLRAAVQPPGDAKPDWWIISGIARQMGKQGFEYESAKDVFNELCSLSPIYEGLNWDRIENGEYQWPVPESNHPGTPRLHEKEFKNGRGLFKIIGYRDPAEVIDGEFPVWLTTGRRLQAYHTRTQTGRSSGIDYLLDEESLEIHPNDAKQWGINDGDFVKMRSRRGAIEIKARLTDRSPRGTVFTSFSFASVPVNILTGSGYDPVTQTAELKVCPVAIELVESRE